MPRLLPIETSAVVMATAADVEARRGAFMLRLWHHVGDGPARALLFADFVYNGRPLGFIDAIICTAQQGRWRGRMPRDLGIAQLEQAGELDRLAGALTRSLAEVLGARASPMVSRAWQDAFRMLLQHEPPPG